MSEVVLTDEQLQERLKYWKEKLRLQDWIIEVKLSRGRDMMEGTNACVNWVLYKKMALIKILDPIDYPGELMGERDMENDLVHELLHLHFAPINDHFGENGEVYNTFEEQAIESITSGLISAERK